MSLTRTGEITSGQISVLGEIPVLSSNFSADKVFLIKNDSDESLTLSVKLANMSTFISTRFYPGWNYELVQEIEADLGIATHQLKYGY